MKFGKIDYLNLLPFHVFMKRYLRYSQKQMSIRHNKNVPSKINALFEKRLIDAAFISSIKAKKYNHLGVGIVADNEVWSVLLLPSDQHIQDSASATSNILAKVLDLRGEVLIGDRALKLYNSTDAKALDLAQEWHRRYGLPFVFALLCYHTDTQSIKKLSRAFVKSPKKIPHYLLQDAAKRSGVEQIVIKRYLTKISYRLDHRSLRSLKLFYRLAQQLKEQS